MPSYLTSNIESLAKMFLIEGRDYRKTVQAQAEEEGRILYETARELSGTQHYTLDELRMMGYPYARINPTTPPMDPGIISFQSGIFYRNWRWTYKKSADGAVVTIYNTAPHADFMLGTRWMIPRPILELAEEMSRAERAQAVRDLGDKHEEKVARDNWGLAAQHKPMW